jgi:dTDP-4-dehydrorhamnose 3,5-epimerase
VFTLTSSSLAGCHELQPKVMEDARGRFVKVFHEQAFSDLGLATGFAEEYYSVSRKDVIRGLHFQTPPMDHVKMAYCIQGAVLDAVLDLRVGSPTYGQFELFELSAEKANSIYIPKGMAHGFCALSDEAVMVYKVGTVYSPAHDAGVRFDSAGIRWPVAQPIVSARDTSFPALADFISPFTI